MVGKASLVLVVLSIHAMMAMGENNDADIDPLGTFAQHETIVPESVSAMRAAMDALDRGLEEEGGRPVQLADAGAILEEPAVLAKESDARADASALFEATVAPLEEAEVEEDAMELVQAKPKPLTAAQVDQLKLALSTAQEDHKRALKLGEKAVAVKAAKIVAAATRALASVPKSATDHLADVAQTIATSDRLMEGSQSMQDLRATLASAEAQMAIAEADDVVDGELVQEDAPHKTPPRTTQALEAHAQAHTLAHVAHAAATLKRDAHAMHKLPSPSKMLGELGSLHVPSKPSARKKKKAWRREAEKAAAAADADATRQAKVVDGQRKSTLVATPRRKKEYYAHPSRIHTGIHVSGMLYKTHKRNRNLDWLSKMAVKQDGPAPEIEEAQEREREQSPFEQEAALLYEEIDHEQPTAQVTQVHRFAQRIAELRKRKVERMLSNADGALPLHPQAAARQKVKHMLQEANLNLNADDTQQLLAPLAAAVDGPIDVDLVASHFATGQVSTRHPVPATETDTHGAMEALLPLPSSIRSTPGVLIEKDGAGPASMQQLKGSRRPDSIFAEMVERDEDAERKLVLANSAQPFHIRRPPGLWD